MARGERSGRLPVVGAQLVSAFRAVGDLVLPGGCAACPASGGAMCPGCRHELAGPAWRTAPVPAPVGLPPTWATSTYGGVARAAILAHKEHGRLALARPLGDALALSASAALGASQCAVTTVAALVPVPSRAAAVRSRGHDATARIARRAAQVLAAADVEVELVPVLHAARGLADQAGLNSAARAANLRNRLVVHPRHRALATGRAIVIVDDVVTTGASLAEAARALRGAGADVVGAAVIAATTRRSSGSALQRVLSL